MARTETNELCAEVLEHLAEVLDGTASPRLLEHVGECDTCRDARHDAEMARHTLADAGLDHRTPADLEARVLAALEARGGASPRAATKPAVTRAVPLPGTRPRVAVLITGLAVAAAAAFVAWRGGSPTPEAKSAWSGRVERVVSSRGAASVEVCDGAGKACRPLGAGAALRAGARIKTDGATRAELSLSDGSRVTLDRGTELALLAEGARNARLLGGALVADVAHVKSEARFELPSGAVTVHGTKFSLRAQGQAASVDVARGSVTLSDGRSRSVHVVEGETGRLEPDAEPTVAYSSSLSDALGWSDEAFESEGKSLAGRGLGELRAKKPGQDAERTGTVTLASHQVRVRIAGAVARTEVEEVFENTTDEVLEGIYRFPLPPDAQIERLALDVDGKLEEGAFVDRDRAAAIFRGAIVNATPRQQKPLEEIIWVPGPWRDPALLEWQRGGRFELRIFPIPKRGSRRVLLAYTEVVKPAGGARRYTYPLAYDPSGTTRVGHFAVDLEVRGNDRDFGVRPLGYALETRPSSADTTALHLAGEGFVPAGDLSLEYALPGRASELTAWTYFDGRGGTRPLGASGAPNVKDDVSPYVALALRPKLPRPEHESGRAVALVVDTSRSMLGASYTRASELAVRLSGELDESDRVTVLACGVDCEVLGDAGLVPGAATAARVRRFLQGITPEDASDLVGGVDRALGALRGATGLARRVVYLGDGAPTVGQVRPGSIERAVRRSVTRVPANVVAVAVGAESDGVTLDALARGGDGVLLPYTPGRSTVDMTYAVLAATYGSALGSVSVTLPEGLGAVAPARLSSIAAGGEAFVFARMNNLEVSGDVVLRGTVGGKPFEQRYPVALRASSAAGNAFVPRLYAAARLADLEREGTDSAKAEAIALSTAFNVASRYTSLLVLESPAMFRAFGLEQSSGGARFTADEAAESTDAEGSEAVAGPEDDLAKDESASAPRGSAAPAKAKAGAALGSGRASASGRFDDVFEERSSRGDTFAAPAATAAPAPAPKPSAPSTPAANADKKRSAALEPEPLAPREDPFLLEERPRRRMIPMHRVWERQGEVLLDRFAAAAASGSAIANAERLLADNPNRRDSVKKLFTLLLQSGELERAAALAERWSEKEPLDPEALTARADVLAARGERSLAIRVLGSVLDARPSDIASEKRLARLERWAGRPALACRFSIAMAELRSGDAALLSDAVRCARDTFDGATGDELLASAAPATREAAERLLQAARPDDQALRGDLRLEAEWRGGADLDLALVDPDGHRVSWLGAATRGIITAHDATSTSREGLGLTGARAGDYAVEIVRSGPGGPCAGELTISVAGTTRRVPFALDGIRTRIGVARVSLHSRLVPL